jgi:bacteriocin biosynthesis cyclodehydratase domain-containing protein
LPTGTPAGDGPAAPRITLTCLGDPADADAVRAACGAAGVAVDLAGPGGGPRDRPGGDGGPGRHAPSLSVVLCEDYLDPALAGIDAAHRASGRPWLLAKPVGTQPWIGPLFEPGAGCWQCLAHRLRAHRHAEACAQRELGRAGPARRPVAAIPASVHAAAHLVALQVTTWLAGARTARRRGVVVLDTVDLSTSTHAFDARPQCPACGDPGLVSRRAAEPVVLRPATKSPHASAGHRKLDPSEVLARFGHLVSPVTGVVKQIRRAGQAPPAVHSYRSGNNPGVRATGMAAARRGLRSESGGKGATALDARVGALCEALERHSGRFQGDELQITGSLRSLGERAIHPNDCLLFSERQFASRLRWNRGHSASQYVPEPFDEHAETRWTPVWSLTERRHRLLPTGMLYFGTPTRRGVPRLGADSNGNAAGTCLADAVLQGLLELIERDAVALWWYNRTRMPAVDVGSFHDPWVEEVRAVYAGLGRDLWVLDVRSDLDVPVMVAVSRRTDGPHERLMVGFGAHLDPRIALRRCVSELNQLLPWALDGGTAGDGLDDPDAASWWSEASVADHPYLVADGGPLLRPDAYEYTHRTDLAEDVAYLTGELARRGLDTLVLDQTRPDVAMPVVKVIVPGLRHFWARFAPGRLFDVPVALGRLDRPTAYNYLNPVPLFL